MSTQELSKELSAKIKDLYQRMAEAYDRVAGQLEFSCRGCPDNCCDSYFLHHTYLEWAYLWEGLKLLPAEQLERISERARGYVLECEKSLAAGQRPQVMCPLNDDGLCGVYGHRLMICRMHGVPSVMTRPDGQSLEFPGCFRCQELVGERSDVPRVDRTLLYRELAMLESEFLAHRRHVLPRVKMTIAQMIVKGPPGFDSCLVKNQD